MTTRRVLPWILLVCLGLRVGFFLAVRPWEATVERELIVQSDAKGYHELAVTILRHGRFAFDANTPPDALRTPLYPAMIAAVYALVGPAPWVVLLAQAIVDTVSCGLLSVLVGRVIGRRAGLLAGGFYAINPILVMYCSTLMSDIPFVFLCVLSLWFLSAAVAPGRSAAGTRAAALAGLAIGLAALTRPVAAFAPIAAAIALLVCCWRRWRTFAVRAVAMVGVFALAVSPWLIRNVVTFGRAGLSTSGPYNLLVLHVGPMETQRRGQPSETVKASLLAEAQARAVARYERSADQIGPFELAASQRDLAIEYISRSPGRFVRNYAAGIGHMLVNLSTRQLAEMLRLPRGREGFDLKAQSSLTGAGRQWFAVKSGPEIAIGLGVAAYLLVTYLCGLVGLATGLRAARRLESDELPAQPSGASAFLWTCLIMACYFAFVTGTAGLSRFALPAIPFGLPFVAAGAQRLLPGKPQ